MSKTEEISQHQKNIKHKEELLAAKEAECQKLQKQIQNMRSHYRLKMTDHAIVRFLSRAGIINMDWVYQQLVTEQVEKYYKEMGDGTYPTGIGNLRVVIKNGVIVTVIN